MYRTTFFFVFCLVVCHVLALGGGSRGGASGGKALLRSPRAGGSRYYGGDYQQKPAREEPKQASALKPSPTKGGLGAWGYVAIILVLILGGAGIYYFTLFYPILCKKERKYDVMEMTTV